jgi:hypothetical protein
MGKGIHGFRKASERSNSRTYRKCNEQNASDA